MAGFFTERMEDIFRCFDGYEVLFKIIPLEIYEETGNRKFQIIVSGNVHDECFLKLFGLIEKGDFIDSGESGLYGHYWKSLSFKKNVIDENTAEIIVEYIEPEESPPGVFRPDEDLFFSYFFADSENESG
jgi:hypothetical protein